MTDSACCACSE